MSIEKIIQILLANNNEENAEHFLGFLSDKLWNLYYDYLMEKLKVAENEMVWNLNIPNAKENQEYHCVVTLPEIHSSILPNASVIINSVSGINNEEHGLILSIAEDKKSFSIDGIPNLDSLRKEGATPESTFEIIIRYTISGIDLPEEKSIFEKKIPFVINQDPRKLWKDIPVDWENMSNPKYQKEDTECAYVKVESLADGTPQKDIVAASKRGRSHAQEGKPRDDHFLMQHMDNGWYIMAVADGAGSAKYSREGSRIACKESVDFCTLQLLRESKDFEDAINNYHLHTEETEGNARKVVGDYIYKIVGGAAFKAHKAINAEAAQQNIASKQYATTLLLTISKKFEYGWFIASFWVGDGAICLFDRKTHTAKLLGTPDEGEYAGQTRFLTMQDIFSDSTAFYQRLRFYLVDDFTALFMMSDGVSDPKFETDANLNNPDKWEALWEDLKNNGVELTDDNEESKNQLLDWLDFWSPGNHDDRTIAILYEGETLEKGNESSNNSAETTCTSSAEPTIETENDKNELISTEGSINVTDDVEQKTE